LLHLKSHQELNNLGKKNWKSIIKVLNRQLIPTEPIIDDTQGRGQILPHIASSDKNNYPTTSSMQTPSMG
jgi:hypothetical protein